MTENEWLNTELGIDVWRTKYRNGNETFEEWLTRVSGGDENVAALIRERKFLFGGRILANRGVDKHCTYSNCYVIAPPEDNLESIWDAAKKMARTYSYGGGCGVDLGGLAPAGARVNNEAKTSSGAVSFMDLYATTTALIGQHGRRGALMLSIPVTHPDTEAFIHAKQRQGRITSANISVRVSDEFMHCVEDGRAFTQSFTRPESGETVTKDVDARALFHELCRMNWDCAEPGVLFWDRIENHNLLQHDDRFHFAGTNPCAEEPLPAGGSCLLGAINLSAFVTDSFTDRAAFDDAGFKAAVRTGVRALNDVLDEGLERHPLEEQRESVRKWRQIGLGVMGLGDMLVRMGLRYGSEEAVTLCRSIAGVMWETAFRASEGLGLLLGNYPAFDADVIEKSEMCPYRPKALRNSQILTIAPTGSLSTMLGISGGIEPIYQASYLRKTQSLHDKDEWHRMDTPVAEEYRKATGKTELPDYFVFAGDVPWKERIDTQAAWQTFIDAAISSTVNVGKDFSVEDTEKMYMYAWQKGLKGLTMYRKGCSREGVLVDRKKLERGEIAPVPDDAVYTRYKLTTGCGELEFFVGRDEQGQIVNLFTTTGGDGGCVINSQALSRQMATNLRAGVPIPYIIKQLRKAGTCAAYQAARAGGRKVSPGKSCAGAIAEVLEGIVSPAAPRPDGTCPKCGGELSSEGGCVVCRSCGWSRCG